MKYRKVKKTGDELSILGFGCMRLPQRLGLIDEARATRQIRHAIDEGVNYVDTAYPYHMEASEPFLAKALSDGYRERVRLATKLPIWNVKTAPDMDSLLHKQLHRLKTETLDYYLLHAVTTRLWRKLQRLGVCEFLDRAKKEGLIRNAGFSYHGDRKTFEEVVDAYDWDCVQLQWNYLDEQNQAGTEGLEYAAAKDIGIIIMEPLRGGLLVGKKLPPRVREIFEGAEVKRSPAEWALRWVFNHPAVTCVLSGMNEEEHIEENLRIANEAEPNSLTESDHALIARVVSAFRSLTRIDCTGCNYCMPCEDGVNIPVCFELYNNRFMFNDPLYPRALYAIRIAGLTTGEPTSPALCTECRKCTTKCPQGLDIPELLKSVRKEFEGPLMSTAVWAGNRLVDVYTRITLRGARKVEETKKEKTGE